MIERKILKVRKYKKGYEVRTEEIDGEPYKTETVELRSAYTMYGPDDPNTGQYIGTPKWAWRLFNKYGIKPQVHHTERLTDNPMITCSFGFCEKEQKWYGWSHRAMFGFGIGSSVKKGDCAYSPKNWDDFIEAGVRFWSDPGNINVKGKKTKDEQGRPVAYISWEYEEERNKKKKTLISGSTMYPPKEWGNGEWTAKTLEDAKQMAIDFAESVS